MIFVDRDSVPDPRNLSEVRQAGYAHAKKFFTRPIGERRQERYYNPFWDKAYFLPVPALRKLFHDKCAFCETKISVFNQRGIVDHLRPKWGTRGLGKDYANDHYWWLAYEWSNLYLACAMCNKRRGPRFPVEGERLALREKDTSLEKPLLLDPCLDLPEKHLRFGADGLVQPLSRRAETTVELFGLNREALVRARRDLLKRKIEPVFKAARKLRGLDGDLKERLRALVSPAAPFSGFARQAVVRINDHYRLPMPDFLDAKVSQKQVVVASRQSGPVVLQRVHIRNFRGIRDLTLNIPSTEHTQMDWLMLIGENAAGKSSILQALTLNLMGQRERDALALDARRFIHRGKRSASVEVEFRGASAARTLTCSSASRVFRCSTSSAATVTTAYGSTRLPPPSGSNVRTRLGRNLFDPFEPLRDARAWMLGLKRPQFDYSARALKSLLALDQKNVSFRKFRGDILVKLYGSEAPLSQLSDGYQSVICVAADLMAFIQKTFKGGMEAAEGVVLLDELGAHLHPRWKMRVTKALRGAFPRLQFIVTTHDPLCLRGLRNGEIAVVERTPRGRVYVRTDLPPIEGMRVDQILQSEFFGLRSAMDPDIERDFDRMYLLKSKATLSSRIQQELVELETKLAPFEILGSTRSERLMLSEINRFLAQERKQPVPAKREALWKKAQQRIGAELKLDLGIDL